MKISHLKKLTSGNELNSIDEELKILLGPLADSGDKYFYHSRPEEVAVVHLNIILIPQNKNFPRLWFV